MATGPHGGRKEWRKEKGRRRRALLPSDLGSGVGRLIPSITDYILHLGVPVYHPILSTWQYKDSILHTTFSHE